MEIIEYQEDGYTVKKTDKGNFWRLIHDGVSVIGCFESNGITETRLTLFVAETQDECQAEIDRLGLLELPDIDEELPDFPEE